MDGADDDTWGFPFSVFCFGLFWAVLACHSAWSTYQYLGFLGVNTSIPVNRMARQLLSCDIVWFEICNHLSYYPAYSGEMSVRNYHYTLHNNWEEHRSHLPHGRNLKPHAVYCGLERCTGSILRVEVEAAHSSKCWCLPKYVVLCPRRQLYSESWQWAPEISHNV